MLIARRPLAFFDAMRTKIIPRYYIDYFINGGDANNEAERPPQCLIDAATRHFYKEAASVDVTR